LERTLTNRQTNFAALLLFLLLTVVAAWPVVSNLNGVIIGLDNDVYINPWADWWTAKALTDPNLSFWYTNYLFYPNGASLVYHSFSHLNTVVSLGLRPFLGPLPAYNVTILLNLVLIGFSVFQLTRYLTKSTTAGILAGIVLAFNSQIQYQTSHPVTFCVWCFPWMTLYLIRAARENSYRCAIIAAVFVFLGAATGIHILILSGLWLALLLGYMFVSAEFPRPPWKILLTFGLSSFLLTLPLVFPLLREAVSNQNTSFVLNARDSVVTDLSSIFIPHWDEWNVRSMYLGIMPAGLFLFALWGIRQRGKLWLLLVIASFLFAIGPVPTIDGEELGITLPWSLAVAPLLRNMYRMLLLFSFGWAMVVAYGWLSFKKTFRLGRRTTLLVGLFAAAAIYADFTAVPFPTRPATVSPFYTDYLDDVPDDVALAILPTGRQEDKWYLYYQTIHKHPMTGGHISRSETETYSFIRNNPLLRAGSVNLEPVPIPDDVEDSFRELAEINVGYFILDKMLMAQAGEDVEIWRGAIPFQPIYEDNFLLVYTTKTE
jgi:hypothetical protein